LRFHTTKITLLFFQSDFRKKSNIKKQIKITPFLEMFDEFEKNSKLQWRQQVIRDLKGNDFEATLHWQTLENISVAPYYTSDDVSVSARAAKTSLGWLNAPAIVFDSLKNTHHKITNALTGGAEAIVLVIENQIFDAITLQKLLHHIKLNQTPVFFQLNSPSKTFIDILHSFVNYQKKGGLINDSIAYWTTSGLWADAAFDDLYATIVANRNSPQFKTLCVATHPYHNAGANVVQELAFGMSVAVTYLDKLTDLGLRADEILQNLFFSVSIGTNYFFEIAKLRALRVLHQQVADSYSVAQAPLYVHAQTSTFYDAALTPNTNWLRATTEAMSAVIGGCDALTVHAYDAVFRSTSEFSEGIARNLSIILKEEAYLDKTIDPAAGSYYIENLTQQLVSSAWALFIDIEKMGGFIAAFRSGFIQNGINQSFENKTQALEKSVMVGVNKFRFDEEPFEKPAQKPTQKPTTYPLLSNKRLSQKFENE
jgi:methylmalonyl-CoA mutase